MHFGTKNILKSNRNHTPIQVKSLTAQVYIYIRPCIEFSLLKTDKRKESGEGGQLPPLAPTWLRHCARLSSLSKNYLNPIA